MSSAENVRSKTFQFCKAGKDHLSNFIIKILMEFQDFSFDLKIISSSRAVKILFSSFACEDLGVAMVTNMISR